MIKQTQQYIELCMVRVDRWCHGVLSPPIEFHDINDTISNATHWLIVEKSHG